MESIQITGNKARFDNYLSSPLVIPENAKVCLNKASFSVPVWTQKYISVPTIDAADYDDNMLFVQVQGVEQGITWREFHTAWDNINQLETRNIANFYNGTYKFWMNNTINFVDAVGSIEKIPTITEVIAEACDTKFNFYKFKSTDLIQNSKAINIVPPSTNALFTLAGNNYTFLASEDDLQNFGLGAFYAPEKVAALAPVTMNQYWTGAGFTRVGDNLTFTSNQDAFAIAKDTLGNFWSIDPNGGYWNFRVDLNDDPGYICAGVIFSSLESKPDTTQPTFATANSIEVGIKFSKDGAINTFQAIDGLITDITGPSTLDAVQDLYPKDKIFTFDNDVDEWFIQIRRAAGYETSSNKFIFRLLHGDINVPGIENAECFYQTEFTLPSPEVLAVPAIFNHHQGGGAGTNEIKDNFIVATGDQSFDMGKNENIFGENIFQITADSNNGSNGEIVDFWSQLGLSQNTRNDNTKVSFNSTNLATTINWDFGRLSKDYFVGVTKNTDIFTNNHPHLILTNKAQPEIPRQMEVSLMNLTHTPHAGSFAMGSLYTEPDINKVVSYINTDPSYFDIQNNVYMEYVYEAFNLVGRRLKNRSKIPLSQFVINLGYKNFLTNDEQTIDQVRGVVKLELLFDVVEGEGEY